MREAKTDKENSYMKEENISYKSNNSKEESNSEEDNSYIGVSTKRQTTKQPNNQTTKQPNNQTTKQPNNQTTKQPNKKERSEMTDLNAMFGKPKEAPKEEISKEAPKEEISKEASGGGLTEESTDGAIQDFLLGQKIPKPTERIKSMEGMILRVSPVVNKITRMFTHYDDVLKETISCFKGECCRFFQAPKDRYLLPVVEYTTDREGNVVDPKFQVNYFRLGKKDYDALVNRLKHVKDPTRTDFLATCTSTTYNTFDFNDIRDEVAVWRQYPEFEERVLAKAREVRPLMVPGEVNQYTREEFLKLHAQATGQASPSQSPSGQSSVSLDDLLKGKQ